MQKLESFSTPDGLKEAFGTWWLGISEQFTLSAQVCSQPIANDKGAYDLENMMSLLDNTIMLHARLVEWTPAAKDYLHQAVALESEALMEKYVKPPIGPMQLKALVAGKVHGYQRVVESVERLSSTLNLRFEALRSMISAEKSRWEHEISTPSQRPQRKADDRDIF